MRRHRDDGLPKDGPWRLVGALRLVSRAALLVLAVAFFYRPLYQVLVPAVGPTVQRLFQPAAARGFMLDVTSRPLGAAVVIDGEARGKTPAILNVACTEGQEVTLVLTMEGFPAFRQVIPCREGQTLRARVRMGDRGG